MKTKLFALSVVFLLANGCALTAVQDGLGHLKTVQSVTESVYGAKTIASFKKPFPAFEGATVMSLSAQITPRENQDVVAINRAISDSLIQFNRKALQMAGLNITVCGTTCPNGKRVDVHFVEIGYNSDLASRISVGNKLRGQLIHKQLFTGQTLSDYQLNVVDNYAEMVEHINRYNMTLIIETAKKVRELDNRQTKEVFKRLNSLPLVLPQHRKLLESAA